MGFSLELFFKDLLEILEKEQKAGKTVKQLEKEIKEKYFYAKQCGMID